MIREAVLAALRTQEGLSERKLFAAYRFRGLPGIGGADSQMRIGVFSECHPVSLGHLEYWK